MATAVSLASVPIVDDHCHASGYEQREKSKFRTMRESQEGFARGYVEARIPHQSWGRYAEAVLTRNVGRLDELDGRYQVRALMDRAVESFDTTVLTHALRVACQELYGEWENQARLVELAAAARRDGLAPFYVSVLDRANIRIAFADVPRLDPAAWPAARFRWIARFDPFLYPFGPGKLTGRGAVNVGEFHARLTNKLNIALREQGLEAPPSDFADYVAFAERAVESFRERGAVAFKILSAYVRSLDFRPVAEAEAARVFRDLTHGRMEERRVFEDYMLRRLLLRAVEWGMPVQVHVGLGHADPGMLFENCRPTALQSLLMDERYSNLKMVLLHGSYPYCGEAAALVWTYGNVYLDFSWMVYLHHHYLIDRLSEWLELLPSNRLLFGVDTGLPEFHLGGTRLGVRALETALSRGVEAGLWSASQAQALGERALYRNACELYGVSL